MRRGLKTGTLGLCVLAICAPGAGAATFSGTLVERHGDPAPASAVADPRVDYVLATQDGTVALEPAQDPELVGQRVVVRDDSVQPGLQGRATPQSTERLVAAGALGPLKVAVVLANFSDNRATPFTADQIRATVFATSGPSVNTFYQQQSGGATSVVGRDSSAGDVYGWYQLPMASTGCDTRQMATRARSAAAAEGTDLSTYDHVVYFFPTASACSFGGLGALPGKESWINGYNSVRIITHELGHNLGVHHASSYTCTGGNGERVSLSSSCTSSEYGDPVDVMGTGSNLMSGFHRARLGQLPAARQRTIKAEGTYALGSLNDPAAIAPGLLLVPRRITGRPVTQHFALDTRTAGTPFDVFSASAPSATGVTVRLVPLLTAATQTQLVDTTPATATVADAPLQPGQTFTDPLTGIVIRAVLNPDGTTSVFVHPSDAPDTQPPTPPGNLGATADGDAQILSWTESDDDLGVARYEIFRGGTLIATTQGTSFRDAAPSGDTVTYRVDAVDAAENRASTTRSVALPDDVAPGPVTSLSASRTGTTVTLRWGAASDNRGVTQYRVSRDDAAPRSVTGLEDVDATAGSGEHTYTVTAVDARGNAGPATRIPVPAAPGDPAPAPAGPAGSSPVPGDRAGPRRPAASAPMLVLPALTGRRVRLPASGRLIFSAPGATRLAAYIGRRAVRTRRSGRMTVTLSRRDRARGVTVRVTATTGAITRTRIFRVRRGVITRVG